MARFYNQVLVCMRVPAPVRVMGLMEPFGVKSPQNFVAWHGNQI